jgi:hypothetical protein
MNYFKAISEFFLENVKKVNILKNAQKYGQESN